MKKVQSIKSKPQSPEPETSQSPKRHKLDFDYGTIDFDFIKAMAQNGQLGTEKYSHLVYLSVDLQGPDSSLNHALEHIRQYQAGERHDEFQDHTFHLAAAAFRLMMEFTQARRGYSPRTATRVLNDNEGPNSFTRRSQD